MPYMSNKERASEVRKEIKKLGLTTKEVSVRVDSYCSILVALKVAEVTDEIKSSIKSICRRFADVDRCSVTGEILAGGNTFVRAIDLNGYSI